MPDEGALGSKPLLLIEVCGPKQGAHALICETGIRISCPSKCGSDEDVESLCKPSNVLL